MHPKISVIVPVYNAEPYLRRCIGCILSQTFADFELLLIDDGSKDRSGAICEEYADRDSRVRVFHKPNGGVSSARNSGLDHALGEWITFCDADDWVYPEWLENFLPAFEGYDLGVQGFSVSYPLGGNTVKRLQNIGFNYQGTIRDGLILLYEYDCVGYLWVKIFKRTLITQHDIRFIEDFALREDEDFLLSYASVADKIICKNAIGYHYRYPQYEFKYRHVDIIPVARSLYIKALKLYGGTRNELVDYYLNHYTDAVFDAYAKRRPKKLPLLRDYRRVVGKNLLKSRLFFLTRWLVYLDLTGILSSCVLSVHSRIKSGL